jgi:hypothetical protein
LSKFLQSFLCALEFFLPLRVGFRLYQNRLHGNQGGAVPQLWPERRKPGLAMVLSITRLAIEQLMQFFRLKPANQRFGKTAFFNDCRL